MGVVFALSIDTGCVVDYSVKSLICSVYKNNKDSPDEWKEAHKLNCSINHEGSSGKMEKDGSGEIFLRSTETRRLRYTTFVGDGDSSSFGAVANAVNTVTSIQLKKKTALSIFKNVWGQHYVAIKIRNEVCY